MCFNHKIVADTCCNPLRESNHRFTTDVMPVTDREREDFGRPFALVQNLCGYCRRRLAMSTMTLPMRVDDRIVLVELSEYTNWGPTAYDNDDNSDDDNSYDDNSYDDYNYDDDSDDTDSYDDNSCAEEERDERAAAIVREKIKQMEEEEKKKIETVKTEQKKEEDGKEEDNEEETFEDSSVIAVQ